MVDPTERTFPMPAHQRLLVRAADVEEDGEKTLESGIVLPATTQKPCRCANCEVPTQGVVTHVGPGYRLADGSYAPMDYQPGDVILFFRSPAVEVEVEGETLLLVRDENVLVVIDGPLYAADVRQRLGDRLDG